MTGFIRGLFGKGKQEIAPDVEPKQQKNEGAYFLDPDDAKTFGDIDYMRKAKTVKRTFAKGSARVRQISAMDDQEVNENGSVAPKPSSSTSMGMGSPSTNGQSSQSSFSSSQSSTPRRTADSGSDSSMDMFRNMAKEIRKK